jgi:Mce-associated membrane protein
MRARFSNEIGEEVLMVNDNGSAPSSLALVEEAEADAAEAEALAAAAKARAKAVRLRHELQRSTDSSAAESTAVATLAEVTATDETGGHDVPEPGNRRRIRRPSGRTVVTSAALVVLIVLVGVNGFLAWRHHGADQLRDRAAQFAAAAQQGVVNMTTLDFTKAGADVARVLDGSTGEFRSDFASRVDDFTSVVRDSKVVTAGTVNATAVESMTADSAVVLVAATSTVTNAAGAKEEPRKWRLSVTVTRDDNQLKMSKVEFVQ